MQKGWIAVLFGASIMMGVQAAQAQHVETGRRIAERWCGNCHAVAADSKPRRDAAPSFVSVANTASTTTASLAVFLSTPHAQMPNYTLTRQEIADISAYILSLKRLQK